MNSDFEIKDNILIKYHGNGGAVIIPDGVTSIGNEAFLNCKNMTDVMIPDSVTNIGSMAFHGCASLMNVIIPDSVESIGNFTFRNCKELKSLSLPCTLKEIGGWLCDYFAQVFLRFPDGKAFRVHGRIEEKLNFMIQKDYFKNIGDKYLFVVELYAFGFDDDGLFPYMKKNFMKLFPFMLEEETIPALEKILNSGQVVTKRTIDKLIQYTIAHQNHQAQILLTDYKYQHFEFKSMKEKLYL
ncbi:MAG: leucine-rich repeat domain-containing protein [Oscillospiraceae bacterium]|nr:leucine-rich repeat domain-containing protein [Oscillospiraceae bacterium]